MFLNRYRRNSSASYMQVIGAFRESICIVSSGTFFERPRLEGIWSIFQVKSLRLIELKWHVEGHTESSVELNLGPQNSRPLFFPRHHIS